MSDIDHIHHHIGLFGVVERVAVDCFQVDEPRNYVRMEGANPTQLFAGNGLADQNRPIKF